MVCVIYVVLEFSLHVSHCLWTVVAKPESTTWTPAALSEYETPSVENGVLSASGEEEEFSHVKMHRKNQDLLAEVLEKDKGTVRGGGAIEREVHVHVVMLW